MVTIKLYGDLTSRFESQYVMQVPTAAEALRGVLKQVQGLRAYIQDRYYEIRMNDVVVAEPELSMAFYQTGDVVIHIVPVVQGAGKWGQIAVGAALIGAAFATGGWSLAGVKASFGATMMFSMGMGIGMGGVAQLLTKTPEMTGLGKGQEGSFSAGFSSLENLAMQNSRVPILYGKGLVTPRMVSQSVASRRVDPKAEPVDPVGEIIELMRTPIKGIAAKSPNGKTYQTDFNNDSVKARLYQVE